jgi:hypothetical protein
MHAQYRLHVPTMAFRPRGATPLAALIAYVYPFQQPEQQYSVLASDPQEKTNLETAVHNKEDNFMLI